MNRVTLPNGRILEGVPDSVLDNPARDDLIMQEAIRIGAATPQDFYNPTEGMSGGGKFLAGVGKGMSDLGMGVKQLFGMASKDDVAEKQRIDKALMDTGAGKVGDIAGKVALGLPAAFVPGANTTLGAAAIGSAYGLAEPVAEGDVLSQKLKSAGTGALFGAGSNKLAEALGGAISSAAKSRVAATQSRQAENAVADQTLKEGLELGLKVNPTQANPTAINRLVEGIAGKISTQQSMAEVNQGVANNIIRRELGLPEGAKLTRGTMQGIRNEAGKAYENLKNVPGQFVADEKYADDIAKIINDSRLSKGISSAKKDKKTISGFIENYAQKGFDPADAVEEIKILRNEADSMFKSDSPKKVAMAKASKKIAKALEGLIERNLASKVRSGSSSAAKGGMPAQTTKGTAVSQNAVGKSGNTIDGEFTKTTATPDYSDLYEQFVKARELIAKTYSVEKSLNPGSGNVRIHKLASQLAAGKPLSGDIEKLAKFGSQFDRATQEIKSSMPSISPLDWIASTGMSAATQNPYLLATMLARPSARGLMRTKGYQKALATPKYDTRAAELANVLGGKIPYLAAPAAAIYPTVN